MNKLLELIYKYTIYPVDLDIPLLTGEKKSKYEQTDSNCWIYGNLNIGYNNLGIEVNNLAFENYISLFGIDNTEGGYPGTSGVIYCDYKKDKELSYYNISLIKKEYLDLKKFEDKHFDSTAIKLRTKLLKQRVVFGYSRVHGKNIQKDIKGDGDIDSVLSPDNAGWHFSTFWFNPDIKKLEELGSRGDDSIYNKFVRDNTEIFIKSIKEGTIKPVVRFLYYKQPRPYTDYRNLMIGGRIDYDKAYGYQCVDLFKDYCDKVLGMKLGQTGNAIDIWNNKLKIFDKNRKQIKGSKDLMQGDIILLDVGTTYQHIGILNNIEGGKVWVLEQNGSSNPATQGTNGDEIRLHGYNLSSILGVRRNNIIEQNYRKEIMFIENKINSKLFLEKNYKKSDDYKITINYKKSIRYLA